MKKKEKKERGLFIKEQPRCSDRLEGFFSGGGNLLIKRSLSYSRSGTRSRCIKRKNSRKNKEDKIQGYTCNMCKKFFLFD